MSLLPGLALACCALKAGDHRLDRWAVAPSRLLQVDGNLDVALLLLAQHITPASATTERRSVTITSHYRRVTAPATRRLFVLVLFVVVFVGGEEQQQKICFALLWASRNWDTSRTALTCRNLHRVSICAKPVVLYPSKRPRFCLHSISLLRTPAVVITRAVATLFPYPSPALPWCHTACRVQRGKSEHCTAMHCDKEEISSSLSVNTVWLPYSVQKLDWCSVVPVQTGTGVHHQPSSTHSAQSRAENRTHQTEKRHTRASGVIVVDIAEPHQVSTDQHTAQRSTASLKEPQ